MRRRFTVALAMTSLACGGSSVSGTVDGVAIAVRDQVSWLGSNPAVDGGSILAVAITNISGTCGVLSGSTNPPNSQLLFLSLLGAGSLTPGNYPIGFGLPGAGATFGTTDAHCNSGVAQSALSGSVTLSEASSGSATGQFDLTFGDAGHLTGSFSAPACAALGAVFTGGDGGIKTCG